VTQIEQINAEVEELRCSRALAWYVAATTAVISILAVRDARHEIKRADVYREIALEAMHSIPDPELVDPIMLALAQTDDTN
jgi:hypothetical protein